MLDGEEILPRTTLCKGCQELSDQLFDPGALPENGDEVIIHQNYAELSKCAETCCNLCKFIRREMHYHSLGRNDYSFTSEDFHNVHSKIRIELVGTQSMDQQHQCGWLWFGEKNTGCPLYRAFNNLGNQRMLGDEVSVEQSLLLCREWLSSCLNGHKSCGPQSKTDPPCYPTRLLQVGSRGQQSINLVLSKDLEKNKKNEYATLSYCWGAQPTQLARLKRIWRRGRLLFL